MYVMCVIYVTHTPTLAVLSENYFISGGYVLTQMNTGIIYTNTQAESCSWKKAELVSLTLNHVMCY